MQEGKRAAQCSYLHLNSQLLPIQCFFSLHTLLCCAYLALLDNNLFNHFLFVHGTVLLSHSFSIFLSDMMRKNGIANASKARLKDGQENSLQVYTKIGILVKNTFDLHSKAVSVIKDAEKSLLCTHIGTVNALFSKDINQTKHKSLNVIVFIN